MIKIAVTGASGRMGQTLIEAIEQTDGVVLGVELDKGDDLSAKFCRLGDFMKYSHSKAMAVFHKIVKLVKNGVLMIIHIYAKVSTYWHWIDVVIHKDWNGFMIHIV
jgi:dihydrodipicolinate reductase